MLNTLVLGGVVGLILPLIAPMLLKRTRYGPAVGQSYFEFVAKALKRPGIGVGGHGDLSLRQLEFDNVYDKETVTAGGVERKIKRTAKNVHRVGKTPFAFFDEKFGVTFDLRDVLIGRELEAHRKDGDMVYTAESYDSQGQLSGIDHYVRGFFEIRERPALDLDLDESVRPITDGSEESDWWSYLYESVRRMYILRQEDMSVFKLIIPFAVAGAAFFLGYYVLGPGPMPGSGSQTPAPIDVGMMLPIGLAGMREKLSDIYERLASKGLDWWLHRMLMAFGMLVFVTIAVAAVIIAGPATVGLFLAAVAVGSVVLPLLTMVSGAMGKGIALADLMLWAGLQGFREPTLDLTEDDRYRFVEAEELGLVNPPKVKLAKELIALSCDVSPAAFGEEGYSSAEVVDLLPDTDLEPAGPNPLPRGYTPTARYTNAGHQAMVPGFDELDERTTYIRSDNWLGRFADAATGDSLDTAKEQARKEYAAGDPKFDDGDIMKYSAMSGAAMLGFWVVVSLVF